MIPASEDDNGRDFVLKPLLAKEKITIWAKQLLIHFSLSDKLLAFLGMFLTAKSHPGKVINFFPCYPVAMPSAFKEHSLDLSFMKIPMCVFRSAPPSQNKEYIA